MRLSKNYTNRVIQSIKETENQLKRAMRYCEDLRDEKLISFLNSHLVKLNKMIA